MESVSTFLLTFSGVRRHPQTSCIFKADHDISISYLATQPLVKRTRKVSGVAKSLHSLVRKRGDGPHLLCLVGGGLRQGFDVTGEPKVEFDFVLLRDGVCSHVGTSLRLLRAVNTIMGNGRHAKQATFPAWPARYLKWRATRRPQR